MTTITRSRGRCNAGLAHRAAAEEAVLETLFSNNQQIAAAPIYYQAKLVLAWNELPKAVFRRPQLLAAENISNEVGGIGDALSLSLDDSQAASRKPCWRAPAIVTTKPMKPQPTGPSTNKWDSVHKCPQCGNVLKLENIDLKAATTGIFVCPNCGLSGPIDIQIIERESQDDRPLEDHEGQDPLVG